MKAKQPKPVLRSLLLNCEKISELSTTATVVVESALIDALVSGEDPNLIAHEDWFSNTLLGQVFDDNGDIISYAQGNEYLNLLSNPIAAIEEYTYEIIFALEEFVRTNDWTQLNLNHTLDIKSVKVARAYKDKWLFLIEGIPK